MAMGGSLRSAARWSKTYRAISVSQCTPMFTRHKTGRQQTGRIFLKTFVTGMSENSPCATPPLRNASPPHCPCWLQVCLKSCLKGWLLEYLVTRSMSLRWQTLHLGCLNHSNLCLFQSDASGDHNDWTLDPQNGANPLRKFDRFRAQVRTERIDSWRHTVVESMIRTPSL